MLELLVVVFIALLWMFVVKVNGFWYGTELGELEKLCINSWIENGYEFNLWLYDDIEVPEGVIVKNASDIISIDEYFTYDDGVSKGTAVAFSNLFRSNLLYQRGGLYIDLDVLCLRPYNFDKRFVFSRQIDSEWGYHVATCIIYSENTEEEIFNDWSNRIIETKNVSSIAHGDLGPHLFTRLIELYNLKKYVLPKRNFCPIDWESYKDVLESNFDSYGVHLYRSLWDDEDYKNINKLKSQNSIKDNLTKWTYPGAWSKDGDEWDDQAIFCNQPYEKWKSSLIETFIKDNSNNSVLEIGCGHGRWSEHLIKFANNVSLVDLNGEYVDFCKDKFKDKENVTFVKNDGKSLSDIKDNSIDFIWSYDVFVHMDKKTQFDYFLEFKRVLKNDGKCIIHHTIGDVTKSVEPGWRSIISRDEFNKMLRDSNLNLNHQTQSWGKNDEFNCKLFNDFISVIGKHND